MDKLLLELDAKKRGDEYEEAFSEELKYFMRSKYNSHEVLFCSRLAEYLIRQKEYTDKDITIITPYRGQMFDIRKELSKRKINNIRVSTVDDFQGEENKIIIVSLVRSNPQKSTGFVAIRNRIIVTLSRARHGLFVISNAQLLSSTVDDWYIVLNKFKMSEKVAPHLNLCCPNHPDTITQVSKASDFDSIIHGGCTEPCKYQLPCGHTCGQKCHLGDHSTMKCFKPCRKVIPSCGHRCNKISHEGNCEPCNEKIDYEFPICKHKIKKICHQDPTFIKCEKKCKKLLECGHICQSKCYQCKDDRCSPCTTKIRKKCETTYKSTIEY